jgi:hypothetical protein
MPALITGFSHAQAREWFLVRCSWFFVWKTTFNGAQRPSAIVNNRKRRLRRPLAFVLAKRRPTS